MKKIIAAIFLILVTANQWGQSFPAMRKADRIRIREAILINKKYGNQIWKGMNKIPFTILLETDSCEYLVNCPVPSGDFIDAGYDSLLRTNVYVRTPHFGKNLLATFPAIDGQNCIVIGTPENTRLTTTAWIITLLHEHFHHYTNNEKSYYADVNRLKLSGGDSTGMWMLNYRFPYDSIPVVKQYGKFTRALDETIKSLHTDSLEYALENYAKMRSAFRRMLKPQDYRYFSLQVWQEGVARYTEYKYLELMGNYRPSTELLALPDFVPFNTYKGKLYKDEMYKLVHAPLNIYRRECFYVAGFAEAVLLDHLNPGWRKNYLKQKFYMEKY